MKDVEVTLECTHCNSGQVVMGLFHYELLNPKPTNCRKCGSPLSYTERVI